MTGILAELMGKDNGVVGGRGGSMHITSVEHGMMGSYAIVGSHLPVAAGAAWSAQYRDSGQVVVCFLGDGATNIGGFHEAMNFAAVWKLPVVYVCENNLYMEYTAIGSVTAVEHPAADRASSYNLDRIIIDGNDPDVVHGTADQVLKRARDGDGPSLIEAVTYRHGGHSRADPAKYRPDEEVQEWLARDPIPMYRHRLLNEGASEEELAAIDTEVAKTVDHATADAKNAPEPGPAQLDTQMWANGGSSWRN